MDKQITKIVLTGGPCAGKTTGLSYLSQKLSDIGYRVVVVPEYATEVINSGISPNANIANYNFQSNILLGQLEREGRYLSFVDCLENEKIVVIFDRGTLDSKAYIDKESWHVLLEELDLNEVKLRDERYDAVIHMRTVAFGKEEFYTKENNEARYESPEEARLSDEKTLSSWIGHPHLRVIDNRDDFASKIHRVLAEVLHVLGEPIPLEIERKYLVNGSFDWKTIPAHYQEIDIEQAYLTTDRRIRKRGQGGVFIYTETHKEDIGGSFVRTEVERRISSREYHEKLKLLIPKSVIIKKKRVCFVYNEQYFELDFFTDMNQGPYLEIELTDKNHGINLPPWIPVIRDVTEEKDLSNRALALHSCCHSEPDSESRFKSRQDLDPKSNLG